MSSSTSVTLRTHLVSWPRSRRRRWSTSKVRYTAACPRWAESYGVMPQLYIVTTGPGSKATTSRRAVSYSRMVNSDAAHAHERPGLVPDVERDTDRRERLDRLGLRETTGIERT